MKSILKLLDKESKNLKDSLSCFLIVIRNHKTRLREMRNDLVEEVVGLSLRAN
jgi:hypothetical protein